MFNSEEERKTKINILVSLSLLPKSYLVTTPQIPAMMVRIFDMILNNGLELTAIEKIKGKR